MAYVTKNEQRRYIELGNLVVDYTDGDVVVFDNVKDLTDLCPLKPMTNLIALCTSGSAIMTVNEDRIGMRTGELILCPPNVAISNCKATDDYSCMALGLSEHIIQGLLHDHIDIWHRAVYAQQLTKLGLSEVNQEELGFYHALIQSKLQNHTTAPYEIMQALVRALLLELCYMLQDTQGMNEEMKLSQGKIIFNRFLNLISNNEVKRQPISHYASQLAITPKYLTMLCLKYSNKTASEWIIQYTTEDIRFYLRNSNYSIKEISAKLGFANMSHFGSYVRKHLGMSPSEFRRGR